MNLPLSIGQRQLAIEDLDRQILTLSVQMNADQYRFLVLIRQFDERAGWLKWGLTSCAQWLAWRCDLGISAAREKVRVAHALKVLPKIARAFESGTLSYSKVRAVTRVATRGNEGDLLAFASRHTAHNVEAHCRQLRNVQPTSTIEANRNHAGRCLRLWRDEARGVMTITVELPMEQGELVDRALSQAMESQPSQEAVEFASESLAARQADALVRVAKESLCGRAVDASSVHASSADLYQVVVHVDESALRAEEGLSDVPAETARRLCCDGSVVGMVHGEEQATPLSVGRKQRTVSTSIRRALWARDRGCVFPGCHHQRFVDAHHVKHWAKGGETTLENLVLLCDAHHRLVHEGGFGIAKDHQARWYFKRPDGRAVPASGYRREDVVDECLSKATKPSGPSAEGRAMS